MRDPDYRCPEEHNHGDATNCYSHHGCRCAPCRRTNNKYQRDWRALSGCDVNLDPTGVQRRLQALARMGWSGSQLAERCGITVAGLKKLRAGTRSVRKATVVKIAALYRECLPVEPPLIDARTPRHAVERRWHAPTCWQDIDRDKSPDCGDRCFGDYLERANGRRMEVAQLTVNGLKVDEIAELLGVSARTVNTDRAALRREGVIG